MGELSRSRGKECFFACTLFSFFAMKFAGRFMGLEKKVLGKNVGMASLSCKF